MDMNGPTDEHWRREHHNNLPLTVTEHHDEARFVLHAAGELDFATRRLLVAPLMRAAQEAATGAVVVDLRRVSLMDTSGVATLLTAHRMLAQRSQRLRVILSQGAQPDRTLRLCRLDDIFEVIDNP